MSWLGAFLHVDLMKEHFVGFALKKLDLIKRERRQALTVQVEEHLNLFLN